MPFCPDSAPVSAGIVLLGVRRLAVAFQDLQLELLPNARGVCNPPAAKCGIPPVPKAFVLTFAAPSFGPSARPQSRPSIIGHVGFRRVSLR